MASCNGCTGQCTGCSGRCEDNCAPGCASGCGSGCEGGCTGTCGGGCWQNCGSGCWGECSRDCGTYCNDSCSGSCERTCRNQCRNQCKNYCDTGCSNETQTSAYANLTHKEVLSAADINALVTFINNELTRRSLTNMSNLLYDGDIVVSNQLTTIQNKLATMGQTADNTITLNRAIIVQLIDELINDAINTYNEELPRP